MLLGCRLGVLREAFLRLTEGNIIRSYSFLRDFGARSLEPIEGWFCRHGFIKFKICVAETSGSALIQMGCRSEQGFDFVGGPCRHLLVNLVPPDGPTFHSVAADLHLWFRDVVRRGHIETCSKVGGLRKITAAGRPLEPICPRVH